ncbi:MAG: type II toxin-antitoxin system Phd/YefM family antitoxin [Holosporales bacterium]|jgi:prevent-host-death family protein|nr:type II toxin-antitoxin system Phd/YefM family antitoxin [Holosporales bacterium]
MERVNVSNARENIYALVESINKTGGPVCVTSKSGNVVMISENEWKDIEETVYLMSNKSTYEAIVGGVKTHADDCSDKLPW